MFQCIRAVQFDVVVMCFKTIRMIERIEAETKWNGHHFTDVTFKCNLHVKIVFWLIDIISEGSHEQLKGIYWENGSASSRRRAIM